jgi:hypothetical protein
VIAICIELAVLALAGAQSPQLRPATTPVAGNTRVRPIDELAGVHPRLLLDSRRLETLRPALKTTHRFLWERYEQDLPRMLAVSARHLKVDDERYEGDLIPELAFAWLMTGREDLRTAATNQLMRIATGPDWEANESLAFLVPAHYITGMALSYDWLYSTLTLSDRANRSKRLPMPNHQAP